MQKTKQATTSRSIAFKLKTVSAAVVSALLVAHASAAGLGKLTVLSGIGQPLRAEIELTSVGADEARSLQPKLASMEAFRQANIEFSPTLQTLRFAVEQRAGRQLIRITSSQPVSEPFVDLLLELNGATGRLVREYTFLLDPPELRAVQPAQAAVATTAVEPPARIPVPTGGPASVQPRSEASGVAPSATAAGGTVPAAAAPRDRANATRTANGNPPGSVYRVQKGDSLSKIANRTKSEGISLDQMLVALYRANPDAFVGYNMNRLRAGQILSVPNGEVSGALSSPEAHGIVIAQAVDFNDYRNKLAGQVASGTAQKTAENRQSASGRIAAKVEERANAANESPDKLRLSKADAAAAGIAAAAQEDRIAREKVTADAASRVKDLEKNVGDLQKLLEVKNRDLAERQKDASGATKARTSNANTGAATTATAVTPVTGTSSTMTSTATVLPKPLDVVPPATAAITPGPGAEPVARPAAKAAPAAEPGLFDDPLGNPTGQAGAALLVALLAALAYFRARRRKPASDDAESPLTDNSLKSNSLFGSTGGQSVDTNNSVFNSSFAPPASNLDSNEVDPVAEADVYIAYGRDAQAEEILKEALRTQPERHAVRVKLLEIYASRKDPRAFESVATELYSMTKGEGDEWAQAAIMGLMLDPENPLYAAANAVIGGVVPSTTKQPLDETADLDAFLQEVSAEQALHDVKSATDEKALADGSSRSMATIDFATAETATPQGNRLPDLPAVTATGSAAKVNENQHLDVDVAGLHFDAIQADGSVAGTPATHALHALPSAAGLDSDLELSADALRAGSKENAPLSALDFDFLRDDLPALSVPGKTHARPAEFVSMAPFAPAREDAGDPVAGGPTPTVSLDLSPPVTPTTRTDMQPQVAQAAAGPQAREGDVPTHSASEPETGALTTSVPLPSRPSPLEFDLSGITLDLPESVTHAAPTAPERSLQLAGATSGAHQFNELDLDTLTSDEHDGGRHGGVGNIAEMATKLDLAVAYQEIGDHEGARELLDEVVKGGSTEQSDKAKSILARLD